MQWPVTRRPKVLFLRHCSTSHKGAISSQSTLRGFECSMPSGMSWAPRLAVQLPTMINRTVANKHWLATRVLTLAAILQRTLTMKEHLQIKSRTSINWGWVTQMHVSGSDNGPAVIWSVMTYWQLGFWKQTSVKFKLQLENRHTRICIWKCRLQNGHGLSRPQCVFKMKSNVPQITHTVRIFRADSRLAPSQ